MVLNGYCDIQKCPYSISIETIPAGSMENPNEIIYGRINCQYASYGGNCDGKNCSILKENGISR